MEKKIPLTARVELTAIANLIIYYKSLDIPILSLSALIDRAVKDMSDLLIKSKEFEQTLFNSEQTEEALQFIHSTGLSTKVMFHPTLFEKISPSEANKVIIDKKQTQDILYKIHLPKEESLEEKELL